MPVEAACTACDDMESRSEEGGIAEATEARWLYVLSFCHFYVSDEI